MDRIAAAIRQARKAPDDLVRIDLPPAVRAAAGRRPQPSPDNRLRLGERPDRVRLEAQAVGEFSARHVRPGGVIVEGLAAGQVEKLVAASRRRADRGRPAAGVLRGRHCRRCAKLLRELPAQGLTVEVNSWGGWRLARQAGVRMESGPGLPVLNSLAARVLAALRRASALRSRPRPTAGSWRT